MQRFAAVPADLVVLDIMMPGTDGFTISSRIRKISYIPNITDSQRSGCGLYYRFYHGLRRLFYPTLFSYQLVMRVKAIFNRAESFAEKSFSDKELSFGDIILPVSKKYACCRDQELKLTNTEYAFMLLMFQNSSRAVSREELLDYIWGCKESVETRAADDTVKRLGCAKTCCFATAMFISKRFGDKDFV